MSPKIIRSIVLSGIVITLLLTGILSDKSDAVSRNIEIDWMHDTLSYEVTSEPSLPQGCTWQKRLIAAYKNNRYAPNFTEFPATPLDVCVYSVGDAQYAIYSRDAFDGSYYFVPTTERSIAVALDSGPMVPISNISWNVRTMVSSGRYFVYAEPSNTSNGFVVKIYKNLSNHIHLNSIGNHYNYEVDSEYSTLSRADGTDAIVDGVSISPSGKWLSFVVNNFGVMRMNLDTGEVRRLSEYPYSNAAWPAQGAITSISNDGRHILLSGTNVAFRLIEVDDTCGDSIDEYDANRTPMPLLNPCRSRLLNSLVDSQSTPASSGLYVYAQTYLDEGGRPQRILFNDGTNWASLSLSANRLYYLALGDSFASGEGDITIDGVDHYLDGTNIYGNYDIGVPRETCHISKRSYPMLLGRAMSLDRGVDMHTVACAGAVISDILTVDLATNNHIDPDYEGQKTHLAKGFGPRLSGILNKAQLQEQAKTQYLPGRIQQVEFVKQAQPKYITLMIGGNDIDFGGVMIACAKNSFPSSADECDYAHGEGFAGEVRKIQDLYAQLLTFYTSLKDVSPSTKIFVVGYPQFMDSTNEACGEMLGLYSTQERGAIQRLITYANKVIENAAHDAGLKYIDISNALSGGELCDKGTYMTGISDVISTMIYTEYMKSPLESDGKIASHLNFIPVDAVNKAALQLYLVERAIETLQRYNYSPSTAWAGVMQELSHPNSLGHEAIFNNIRNVLGENLLDSAVCSERVICPDNTTWGKPSPQELGLELDQYDRDTSYASGKGMVEVEGVSETGGRLQGVLQKGPQQQTISLQASMLEREIDSGHDVIVELHSQTVVLGVMREEGSHYQLRTVLPSNVGVGPHVLHVKGRYVGGDYFNLDLSVFVQGRLGDIDDDGVQDDIDTCAFGLPSGVDADYDGIDDRCDFLVSSLGTTYVSPIPITNTNRRASVQILNNDHNVSQQSNHLLSKKPQISIGSRDGLRNSLPAIFLLIFAIMVAALLIVYSLQKKSRKKTRPN